MAQAQQLLSNLDLNDGIYDNRNLIVVHQKGEMAAEFLLHFLVSDFIRRFGSQSRIILVLNHTNISRWISISSRLGYNLQSLIERGQIEIVDLLKTVYESITSNIDNGSKGSLSNAETTPISSSSEYIDIEKLTVQIKERLQNIVTSEGKIANVDDTKKAENKKVLIIVENLSDIYLSQRVPSSVDNTSDSTNSNENHKPIMEFIRQLKNLNIGTYQVDISVLTLVKSSCMDDVLRRFSNLLTQVLSSIVFEISPLVTGFSTNISGFLTVKCLRNNRYTYCSSMERHWTKSHNFKLEDRSIKITPL